MLAAPASNGDALLARFDLWYGAGRVSRLLRRSDTKGDTFLDGEPDANLEPDGEAGVAILRRPIVGLTLFVGVE